MNIQNVNFVQLAAQMEDPAESISALRTIYYLPPGCINDLKICRNCQSKRSIDMVIRTVKYRTDCDDLQGHQSH